MPKIHKLSTLEAQKVAAGEVVDRPANIVKEIIENSIDAGATTISLYIEDGGKQLIRIVDNGCGMEPEDALLCFDQYATSKIKSFDELELITTFGFRGEALASIAAVSKITLITAHSNSGQGVRVHVEAGTITQQLPAACVQGTDLHIRDLFFNVPVRKKFLKKTDTEWRQIVQLFQAFCLDYTTIHFKLFHDGKLINNCPSTDDLITRAAQLWDHDFAKNLISTGSPLENVATIPKTINVSGVISNHHYYRYDRNLIYLFVNRRWVKNYQLSQALIKGYNNVLPRDRYPAACIFIEIDPREVDVNIHPRKEEVRFLNPNRVATMLTDAVTKALERVILTHSTSQTGNSPLHEIQMATHYTSSSSVSAQHPTTLEVRSSEISYKPTFKQSFRQDNQPQPNPFMSHEAVMQQEYKPFDFDSLPIQLETTSTNQILPDTIQQFEQKQQPVPVDKQETFNTPLVNAELEDEPVYHLIGQFNKTYLLFEHQDGLFMLDQHAAHERILYELFAARFEDIATVELMFPQIITLSRENMEFLDHHLDLFTHNGITLERFSEHEIIVKATPIHVKNINVEDLIKQVLGWISESTSFQGQEFKTSLHEKLRAQMACHAAVKAGDELTREQMLQVITDLNKTKNRFACPHGRPTGWLLRMNEIEKKFKRDYKS